MKPLNQHGWIYRFGQKVGKVLIGTSILLFMTGIEAGVVKLDMQGCRASSTDGYHGETVQDVNDPSNYFTMYFCNDASYTEGNLKDWAELDLVPHRIIFTNTTGSDQNFTFKVGGDYKDATTPNVIGWDYITKLTLDEYSTPPEYIDICRQIGGLATQQIIISPDESEIYRQVQVEDYPDGATCVAIYNMRLAIGSHLYSGSSLQSRLISVASSVNVGDQTIPIPAIAATTFSKTMSATQGGSRTWSVIKSSNPVSVSFDNTCDNSLPLQKDVDITVSWEKGELTPAGDVNVYTVIQASNTAQRDINISVVDTLYSGTTELGTFNCDPFTLISGLGNQVVCSNTFTISESSAINLNDRAVATYIDIDHHDAVSATLYATATAFVQGTGDSTDENATIKDYEWITGDDLSFSVASPAIGTFDNYIAGTETIGDVNWTSNLQTESGSVIFTKTIYAQARTEGKGSLNDIASLKTFGGIGTNSGILSVNLSSTATVALTIIKTMATNLIPNEGLDFNFTVRNEDNYIRTVTIGVSDSNPSNSYTIYGLDPTTYNVQENPKIGYEAEGNSTRIVDINLPKCSASVEFINVIADRPAVKVRKVTFPEGSEADWVMTLYKWNGNGWDINATGTTSDAGWLTLVDTDNLLAGTYKIEEIMQDGWYEAGRAVDCNFTYHPDIDGNRSDYECVLANAKYSEITIEKVVEGSSPNEPFAFSQNIDSSILLELNNGDSETFSNLLPGSYDVTENDPVPDFDLTNLVCSETNGMQNTTVDTLLRKATIELEAGESVTCTFTNSERGRVNVIKLEDGDVTTEVWTFTIEGEEGIMERNTSTGILNFEDARLVPGRIYTLCEINLHVGWDSTWMLDGSYVTPTIRLQDGYIDRCYAFSVDIGETAEFRIDNLSPHPSINIEKFTNGVDADTVAEGVFIPSGDTVTWTYVVTNFGDRYLTEVIITDDIEGLISCPQTTLTTGESMTCIQTGIAIAGAYENNGSVRAYAYEGVYVEDWDLSHYYGGSASIDIEKHTNGEDADTAPGALIRLGESVTWDYFVHNTGNMVLNNIVVTDDKIGVIACPKDILVPDERMTCTVTSNDVVEGPYENNGSVVGMTERADYVRDSDLSHYTGEYLGAAHIGDFAWYDDNLNGIFDTNEVPAKGLKVELLDESGTLVADKLGNSSYLTDVNGLYLFHVEPGTYSVRFSGLPEQYTFTKKINDSVADINGNTDPITVVAGENNLDIDVGIYCSCIDIIKDKGSAINNVSAILMILISIIFAIYFIREEEFNQNRRSQR